MGAIALRDLRLTHAGVRVAIQRQSGMRILGAAWMCSRGFSAADGRSGAA
jgi:hypothetical protein